MTVRADPLRARGSDVAMLSDTLRRGGSALESVPHQIKALLRSGDWRHFVTKLGKDVQHQRYVDFVTEPPLAGLGTTPEMVSRLIEDDAEAVRLHREELKGTRNNITGKRGTRRDYALERLERDAPELHADVVAGRLSAHAAMVQAGYSPPIFTVRADSPTTIAASLRRRLAPDQLAELARLLTED